MSEPRAYLVDDDEAIRDALSWLLKSRGIPAPLRLGRKLPGCVEQDHERLPGARHADDRHERTGLLRPVARARIDPAGHLPDRPRRRADCRRHAEKGAFDFFEKPFNDNDLATRIEEAMALDASQRKASATVDSVKPAWPA
jgi:two-component system response regulator DctR